jgi:hypothetical protein
MSTNNTIRGIKILPKGGVEIDYVFHDIMHYNGEEHDIPRERREKVHADPKGSFFTAMNLMKPHLLALTDMGHTIDAKYIKARTALEDPRMERWRVDSVSIKGDLEDTEIVISGARVTKRGSHIPFKNVAVKIYNSTFYEFSGNLAEDWEALADEAEAILGGSFSPMGQFKLELS